MVRYPGMALVEEGGQRLGRGSLLTRHRRLRLRPAPLRAAEQGGGALVNDALLRQGENFVAVLAQADAFVEHAVALALELAYGPAILEAVKLVEGAPGGVFDAGKLHQMVEGQFAEQALEPGLIAPDQGGFARACGFRRRLRNPWWGRFRRRLRNLFSTAVDAEGATQ